MPPAPDFQNSSIQYKSESLVAIAYTPTGTGPDVQQIACFLEYNPLTPETTENNSEKCT
jgi:hypothetical protein